MALLLSFALAHRVGQIQGRGPLAIRAELQPWFPRPADSRLRRLVSGSGPTRSERLGESDKMATDGKPCVCSIDPLYMFLYMFAVANPARSDDQLR